MQSGFMKHFLFLFLFVSNAGASELEGKWRQDCSNSTMREEFFSGEEAIFSENSFFDALCSEPSFVFISKGKIRMGEKVVIPTDAREIDFTFESVSLLVLSAKHIARFNNEKMCGISHWVLGEKTDITGRVCSIFGGPTKAPERGSMRYGIYKVEKDSFLFFGKLTPEFDAKSPDKRPRVYDPFVYRKY